MLNFAPCDGKSVICFWGILSGIVTHLCYACGERERGVEIINSRSWDVSQMCVMCILSLRDSRRLINQSNTGGNTHVYEEKLRLKIP